MSAKIITIAIDLVSDGEKCYVIRNGRPEMSKITGTGCQLSGMTTAFIVANPDNLLEATAAAVCTMGLAGEIAFANMAETDGNSTYRKQISTCSQISHLITAPTMSLRPYGFLVNITFTGNAYVAFTISIN